MSESPLSDSAVNDTEAGFASTAGKQLLVFGIAAILGIVLLMFALQTLAGLVGSSTVTAQAVDYENQGITIVLRDEPPQLDSTQATDAISGVVLGHVMEGLLRMDQNDQLEAAIAKSWEITDTHATFWLREDAKWSDGKPVTAHDFVFGWTTGLLPEVASEYAFLLYHIKNARKVNDGTLPPEALGLSAPDDYTLVVELEQPVAFFDKMVTFQTYLPVREDFYKATNGRYGADAWEMLYNGPFMIDSWVHGASMLMTRNPHYWDQERIKLNTINVGYITSDAAATLNFFKDEKIVLARLQAENLDSALEERWQIKRFQDGAVYFLDFNHREGMIGSNWNFRRALQLSLDMEELVYKVTKLPGYLPGESLFPEFLMGVNDNFRKEYPAEKIRIDQDKARQHLELAKQELGLSEIPPITLLSGDNPVSNIQSEWVQASLKKNLGLDIRIDRQIFKQRLAKMTAGDFDLVLAGWGPDYDDPLTFGDLYASWNLNNRGAYNNKEMDDLIIAVQSTIDQAERMEIFGKIQQLLIDDVAQIPMYERGITYVVHPQLKGLKRRVIGPDRDFTESYVVAPDQI